MKKVLIPCGVLCVLAACDNLVTNADITTVDSTIVKADTTAVTPDLPDTINIIDTVYNTTEKDTASRKY